MPADRPITLNRFLHAVLALTVIGALVWLLYTLRAVLIPFFVALLLAYLVDPWVARVQRLVRHRAAAVSIASSVLGVRSASSRSSAEAFTTAESFRMTRMPLEPNNIKTVL